MQSPVGCSGPERALGHIDGGFETPLFVLHPRLLLHFQTRLSLVSTKTFDPELIPPEVLEMLLVRDELLSPQEYLQLYKAPLNISIDFGEKNNHLYLAVL